MSTPVNLLEEAMRNVLAAEKLIHAERYPIAGFWEGHRRGKRWARIYAVRDALDAAIVEERTATFYTEEPS